MKRIALYLALFLFATTTTWGMAFGLSLADAIEQADVIAHIRIDDNLEMIPRTKSERRKDGLIVISTNSDNPDTYRKLATATIVSRFKGDAQLKQITIRHTNGYTCPNVIYRKGEDYIVFLRKEPGSEHYVTMNHYAGQFRIKEGQVINFYLMTGFEHPKDLYLPYEQISAFLTQSIKNKKG